MNQWVGGEDSPSARCPRGFLDSLNALHADRGVFIWRASAPAAVTVVALLVDVAAVLESSIRYTQIS